MKKLLSNALLVIALLMAFVTPVTAEVIINDDLFEHTDTSKSGKIFKVASYTDTLSTYCDSITFRDITFFQGLSYVDFVIPGNHGYDSAGNYLQSGRYEFSYQFNGAARPGVIYISRNINALGTVVSTKYTIFLNEWDIGDLTGWQGVVLPFRLYNTNMAYSEPGYFWNGNPQSDVALGYAGQHASPKNVGIGQVAYQAGHASYLYWANHLNVTKSTSEADGYDITLLRTINNKYYTSTITIYNGDDIVYTNTQHGTEVIDWYPLPAIDRIIVTSPTGKNFTYVLDSAPTDPADPDDPTDIMRTGTVTMTDNNGTTISGFEVTAVNHYTDQSYTVATDTDVAVITLPMDRTISMRNPQTGEYEEAPVGYYLFYGQAPGYKMLNDDGIRVTVMPEKYGSYQLCDIRVTSESGYLTGKHQFQIRSRSDNSILQTGTISAKSATTGDWYNTTVSGGIATLILPYDTSNTQSQYAGNYYVYATSPGYEPNDYGTQIVVMPHTVSEIRAVHLTPIGGIPTPGNVTLRIQAFSETGQGVVNAEIFIAGVLGEGSSLWDTYTASSTGYLTVSVPGNSTYDIVASGAGYYDSARRIEVFTEDPPLIEIKLYLSGAPTVEPTIQPTGWPTTQPTTQPTGVIPDEDDESEGFLMEAVRGIGLAFGVGFATAKLIFGMLLALSIGYATAKQLRGGAAEFGLGLTGGTLLGVLIGLLPVWIIVVLLLVVGLYIGNRYVGGGNHG